MNDSLQLMNEKRLGVTIVHVGNQRLLEPHLSDNLTRFLCTLVEEGAQSILLDLGAVNRISSVFFRSFIIAGKKAHENKTKISFCNLAPVVKEGFVITGLDKLFKVYESEAKALIAMGEK